MNRIDDVRHFIRDVNRRNKDNWTPLTDGKIDILKLVFYYILNLLKIASMDGYLDIVKLLVDNNAEINATTNNGDNAVYWGNY